MQSFRLLTKAMVVLSCYQLAESFALPAAKKARVDKPEAEETTNRVFVAGILSTAKTEDIKSALQKFGSVQDVLIIGQAPSVKKSKNFVPYAFVTFDDEKSAQAAIDALPPSSNLYEEIQLAKPPSARKRSNKSRLKEEEILQKVDVFGKEANCIIQVQLTHLDRLENYLSGNAEVHVLGSAASPSKNISLLFLRCIDDPTTFTRKLDISLLARAINKVYTVQPGQLFEGDLSTDEGCKELANVVCQNISSKQSKDDNDVSLRMQLFPPKYQSRFLKAFDAVLDEADNSHIDIDPKQFTHMLSIVEVYQYKGRGWLNNDVKRNNVYMWGITPASFDEDVYDFNNAITDGNDIKSEDEINVGRAYYKLKEAIEMYKSSNNLHQDLYGDQVVALDCGSAPGGWTKYLIEHFQCKKVYSIDPGMLAPSVLSLPGTEHMQMTVQEAVPILQKDGVKASIYVSDMCLHIMDDQVDLLLTAKEQGILAPNALVVLTLKCIVGRSKSAYDAQAKRVVDKLVASANVEGLEIFHLFCNRSGERTVMGYLK